MTTLKSLLRQGPGPNLAFLPEPHADEIAETLVAFANAEGGTVVLGVHPNGTIGNPLVDEEADGALREALALCRPPVSTDWQQSETPAGSVVLLRVSRSNQVHRLVDGRVMTRVGNANRTVSEPEIATQAGHRPLGDFELEPVPGSGLEDLDDELIETYLEKRQKRSPLSQPMPTQRLLQQIGAIGTDGTPTVSGLLLFGREPQLFLPHARAVFVKFAESQPHIDYGRRVEVTGALARIVDTTYRVTLEEMDRRAVVRGLQREEETEYPVSAVREALVNAVCHRDYRLTGRSIEVRMYADRLEIISPGGLPAYITLDNIVDEHYSRNPRIVNGLYHWGYIEELGLGVDRMIEEMVAAGHAPPQFEATDHRFSVKLQNKKDPSKVMPHWEQDMNERQLKAMQYVQVNGSITNREYRDQCPHVTAETLRLDLVDLVEKGLLLKIGDKRGTRYIMK